VAIMEPNPATSNNEKKDKKPCHNKKEITWWDENLHLAHTRMGEHEKYHTSHSKTQKKYQILVISSFILKIC
jgi:hypothetical protein